MPCGHVFCRPDFERLGGKVKGERAQRAGVEDSPRPRTQRRRIASSPSNGVARSPMARSPAQNRTSSSPAQSWVASSVSWLQQALAMNAPRPSPAPAPKRRSGPPVAASPPRRPGNAAATSNAGNPQFVDLGSPTNSPRRLELTTPGRQTSRQAETTPALNRRAIEAAEVVERDMWRLFSQHADVDEGGRSTAAASSAAHGNDVPEAIENAADAADRAPLASLFADRIEALVSGLPRLGGAWLLCETGDSSGSSQDVRTGSATSSTASGNRDSRANPWRLWFAHQAGERGFGHYPARSKLALDGQGGVWILGPETSGEADWALWHLTQDSQELYYHYPADSRIVGDGQGGVWILCETEDQDSNDSEWCLWHATIQTEKRLYTYPKDSTIASDGQGGLWILCETDRGCAGEVSLHRLWHATPSKERALHSFPANSKLAGDGKGGVWVLSDLDTGSDDPASNGNGDANWNLVHVTDEKKQSMFLYPSGSLLQGDSRGGVWIFCETTGGGGSGDEEHATNVNNDWCLWHAGPGGSESCLFTYPKDSKMAGDGLGGLWLLSETTQAGNEEVNRSLWHATKDGERNLFSYPEDSILAT